MLFSTASLAKNTAEVLITGADKTQYYEYFDFDEEEKTVKSDTNKVTCRIVDINEVIPSIYRYNVESYGVTIIDRGQIVARFDTQTETLCTNWSRFSDNQKMVLMNEINNYVIKPVYPDANVELLNEVKDLYSLFQKIYGYDVSNDEANARHPAEARYRFTCAWLSRPEMIAQRIDSDLSRQNRLLQPKCTRN